MKKVFAVLGFCLLMYVSVASADTIISGDLKIRDGGDVVFSDGSVQSKAQVQGPVGPQGPSGATGPANKLTIGTVANGGSAVATITGAAPTQVLNLTLPQGPKGETGSQGPSGTITVGQITKDALCAIYVAEGFTPPVFCSPYKKVFVSSKKFTGDMDGLTGADQKCQQMAQDAGLTGIYKAWLSDSSVAAPDRMTHNSLPYVRTDGQVLANDWNSLVASGQYLMQSNIICDEYKNCSAFETHNGTNNCAGYNIWVGPTTYLMYTSDDMKSCDNWTSSQLKDMSNSGSNFIDIISTFRYCIQSCSTSLRIYCFQQ
jgi:hypothetical protein